MELNDILIVLKHHKPIISRKYGVEKIGVFGSYARGTADDKSDIDLYVEFREKTVDNLLGLMVYLNEIFHQKIDLIHRHKYNNKVLIKHIQDEVVYG
jgi:predicted nucleotidyltransferase